MVHWSYWEVSLLITWFVAKVLLRVISRIPSTFNRVYMIKAFIVGLVKTDMVENVKLDFRAPVTKICYSSGFKILLGFLGKESRIPCIWLGGYRIFDVCLLYTSPSPRD